MDGEQSIDPGRRARIEGELWKGEEILWIQTPALSPMPIRLLVGVPFVAYWACLGVWLICSGTHLLPPLHCAAAVLVVALTVRYLIVRNQHADRIVYVITNHRAMIFSDGSDEPRPPFWARGNTSLYAGPATSIYQLADVLAKLFDRDPDPKESPRMSENKLARTYDKGWPRKVYSYPHLLMRRVFVHLRRGGRGDVIFDLQSRRSRHGDKYWLERGFKSVCDPKAVQRRLDELARNAKANDRVTPVVPSAD